MEDDQFVDFGNDIDRTHNDWNDRPYDILDCSKQPEGWGETATVYEVRAEF